MCCLRYHKAFLEERKDLIELEHHINIYLTESFSSLNPKSGSVEPLMTISLIGSGCCHSVRRKTKVMSSTLALPPLQVMHFPHLLHFKSMRLLRSLPFILCISSSIATSGRGFPARVQDNLQKETEESHME